MLNCQYPTAQSHRPGCPPPVAEFEYPLDIKRGYTYRHGTLPANGRDITILGCIQRVLQTSIHSRSPGLQQNGHRLTQPSKRSRYVPTTGCEQRITVILTGRRSYFQVAEALLGDIAGSSYKVTSTSSWTPCKRTPISLFHSRPLHPNPALAQASSSFHRRLVLLLPWSLLQVQP